jgi:GNAT superfamily N-acetyltransferase
MDQGVIDLANLEFQLATPARWHDLETLFSRRGAPNECWCMWWRLTRAEWDKQKGEGNRKALKALVDAGEVPGLLAYLDGQPVGWCSVGPREAFPSLDRSRTLKRVDDQPVWSIVCFYVARPFRRQGVMKALLSAAVEYAGQNGAKIVEGYPLHGEKEIKDPASNYMGLAVVFQEAGFEETQQRSTRRSVMRFFVRQ